MEIRERQIIIELPDEFLEWCEYDMTKPEIVLCGFISDLLSLVPCTVYPRTDGYHSNGSAERDAARAYYDCVGYSFKAEWIRKKLPHLAPQAQNELKANASKFRLSLLDCHADSTAPLAGKKT